MAELNIGDVVVLTCDHERKLTVAGFKNNSSVYCHYWKGEEIAQILFNSDELIKLSDLPTKSNNPEPEPEPEA